MYLIDANVLIRAHGDFYPIDRVPQFWDWLIEQGQRGNVKIPPEIYDEITAGDDALAKWAKDADVGLPTCLPVGFHIGSRDEDT